ncbi:MAG: acyltransferase family protein [Sporichthyaceae bacterium]
MATITESIDQPGQRRPAKKNKFKPGVRTDIQGLRALAVGLIIVYHLWPQSFHGGFVAVEVFFVVSGFLITSHLLSKPPGSGRDLIDFWMRRVRRLLPAALFVLVATMLLARLVAPETVWRNHATEGIASALYFQNWELANQSVDYMAADRAASALQHYWTLSVEEQFYAVWPLLVVAAVVAARRLKARLETTVLAGVSMLFLGSLAWSILYTQTNPEKAYFVTPTRVWEFATGALLATLVAIFGKRAAAARHKRVYGELLVWGGYAALAFGLVTYHGTDYPGYKALLPVLGTAAIIAGYSERGPNPNLLLRNRPSQLLGDTSYSVYLWHWPLIVLVPYATGHELTFVESFVVAAAGIALGVLTKFQVEDRFRRPKKGQKVVVPFRWAAVGMAGVVALGMLQISEVDRNEGAAVRELQLAAASTDPCFASSALRADNDCSIGEVPKSVPSPALAPRDRSFSYAHDCQTKVPFNTVKRCVFGDKTAEKNVALVGNSHAIHWLPGLHQVALKEKFKITTYFTEQCFATTVRIEFSTPEQTENCHRWGSQVLKETSSKAFDLVVTSNRTYKQPVEKGPRNEVFQKGYREFVEQWLDSDRKVLVIRDTPLPDATLESVPDCLAQNPKNPAACSGERNKWIRTDPLADAARTIEDKRVSVANLSDWFCSKARCPSVIGRATVYFDASHMTATYSRSLAPVLRPIVAKKLELDPKTGKLPSGAKLPKAPKPDPAKDRLGKAADVLANRKEDKG